MIYKSLNKYLVLIGIAVTLFGSFSNTVLSGNSGPTPVSRGSNTAVVYNLLEGIPGGPGKGSEVKSPGAYFVAIFKFGVGISIALAVLMLVIAGIEYMSPTGSSKSDAKDRATMAILGLLLVLASYLILEAINPDLLDLGLL